MDIKIIVNDHPQKGHCSLEEHFKQNIENFVPYLDKYGNIRDLHPSLKDVIIEYPTSPEDDSVELYINSKLVGEWRGSTTLDLGVMMADIIVLIKANEK